MISFFLHHLLQIFISDNRSEEYYQVGQGVYCVIKLHGFCRIVIDLYNDNETRIFFMD